jgi:hypothetical protein
MVRLECSTAQQQTSADNMIATLSKVNSPISVLTFSS